MTKKFEFTKKEMLEFFNIRERTLYDLLEHNDDIRIRCKLGYDMYDAKIFNDFYIQTYKSNTNIKDQLLAEKLRYEKARAEKAELNVQERKGELKSIATIQNSLKEMILNFKRKLLSFKKGIAPLLVGKKEIEIGNILETEINKILAEMAQGIKKI